MYKRFNPTEELVYSEANAGWINMEEFRMGEVSARFDNSHGPGSLSSGRVPSPSYASHFYDIRYGCYYYMDNFFIWEFSAIDIFNLCENCKKSLNV